MTITALLTGGRAHGYVVDVPLEALPPRIDWVSEAGTLPYERVGYTAEYRPSTVLGALEAPARASTRKKAKKK